MFFISPVPYTHSDPAVVEQRVREIRGIAARVINECPWVVPFVPTSYTHDLAPFCPGVDWVERIDLWLLGLLDGMIICKQPGWEASVGIQREMEFCMKNGILFIAADPDDILMACQSLIDLIESGGSDA